MYTTIDREIVRQKEGGGSYRQIDTTQNNRQIERLLDREKEEVATDRCIQFRTIDRQREGSYRQMYTTQKI